MIVASSCKGASYREISGDVTISDEWVTLSPGEALRAEKKFDWVLLKLDPPFKNAEPAMGNGILTPDGEIINPEIQLTDQYGKTFNFVYRGARGGDSPIYGYPYPYELPRDREYKSVRIRSPRPIRCKAIYWYGESSIGWK
jgi:hypothetical protein